MKAPVRSILLIVLTTLAGAACATTRAETPGERPALDVPLPPPRVITPLPVQPQAPAPEPVGDLPGNSTQTPSRPRPQQRQPETPKPEAKPEETAKPPENPPAPVTTVPQLRMPETDSAQLTNQIRDIINRTRTALKAIDYGPLSNARKKAYDDANMFATQAEEAVKTNNLMFAKELADKAERFVKELQGR